MRWTPLQKLSISNVAAFLLLGLGGVVSYYFAARLTASERFVARTNQNITSALAIIAGTQDAVRATKAYVVRGDSLERDALNAAQATVEDAVDAMNQASEDNPRQRRLLGILAQQVAASFGEFRTTFVLREHAGAESAKKYLVRQSPPHESDSLMKIVNRMRDEELRILAEYTRAQSATGQTTLRVILLVAALAFLLAALALQPMRPSVAARITSQSAPVDDAPAVSGDAPV